MRFAAFEERFWTWLEQRLSFYPDALAQAVRYACREGKRVRPALCLGAASACGADFEQAIAPAIALELIHCSSLVHDDLPAMDNDQLRRGMPTVHVKFGEAEAILAGDALLVLAFAAVADGRLGDLQGGRRSSLAGELALAAGGAGMIGGQAEELAAGSAHGPGEITERTPERAQAAQAVLARAIAAGKTGALLRAAVRMGGIAAGAGPAALAALTAYGERLGLAYQVVDDLGDETKDAAAGRNLNFAVLLGRASATALAARLCREAGEALDRLAAASPGDQQELARPLADLRAAAARLEAEVVGDGQPAREA